MSGDPLNLSGAWHGIFNYPRHLAPTPFEAALSELNGEFSGTTQEPDRITGEPVSASLIGRREGTRVSFTKFYDRVSVSHGMRRDSVLYEGTLSGDSAEITGRWQIPGNWSGTFIMVRPVSAEAVEERVEMAPVGPERD